MNRVKASLSASAPTRLRSTCSGLSSRASTAAWLIYVFFIPPTGLVAGARAIFGAKIACEPLFN
jgi:hypothetical protein